MAISVYFSKPDWHCDDYWHRDFGTAPTRNVNYSIQEYPQLWDRFVSYTHRQLEELGSDYGKIDCLWLDGGWVNKDNLNQDIRLGEIVEKLRKGPQPHLIVCDRTVGGEYENIVTPSLYRSLQIRQAACPSSFGHRLQRRQPGPEPGSAAGRRASCRGCGFTARYGQMAQDAWRGHL